MSKIIPPPPPKPRTKRARNNNTPMHTAQRRVLRKPTSWVDPLDAADAHYGAVPYPSGVTGAGEAPRMVSSNMTAVSNAIGAMDARQAAAKVAREERKIQWNGRTSKDPKLGPTPRLTDHHARSNADR